MKKLILYTGSIVLLLLMACSKAEDELPNLEYTAEFAIPVIKDGAISFTELWQNRDPNQSLLIQPDGRLVFRYESEQIAVTTLDILGELEFPIIAGLPDTVSVLPFELPANITIQEALISGGILLFQFQAIKDGSSEVTFELPQITLNDEPLIIRTGTFSGSTIPVNLAGYTFRPQNNNELIIRYTAMDQEGNRIILENAGIIARPVLTFVKGSWGREEFQLNPTTIAIDLYDDRFLNGNVRFTEPTITAYLESSFGVPIRSRIDILNAHTKRGFPLPIDASAIDGIDINYPLLEERGQSKKTVLQLDYTNSNIVEVFDAQVDQLEYGLTAIANPDDNPILTSFVEDTSTFKAQVVVEVPVVGRTSNFITNETFEAPFEKISEIAEGEFKLITENELPVAAELQLYFADDQGVILDSLFAATAQIVAAAPVDKEGDVTGSKETITFISVSAEKMDRLIKAHQIRVRAAFQTSNKGSQNVIIRADQFVHFRMGLKFKTK